MIETQIRSIAVRWNEDLNEWETWSKVLQGWTVANNLLRDFTNDDVKAYYAQYGILVHFE